MSHTAIDVIRVLLEESDDDHLWWYVTALRGCDIVANGDIEFMEVLSAIKSTVTCPLRGNVTTAWGINEYDKDYLCNNLQILNEISKSKYSHYVEHAACGYIALSEYYHILEISEQDSLKQYHYRSCSEYCNQIRLFLHWGCLICIFGNRVIC